MTATDHEELLRKILNIALKEKSTAPSSISTALIKKFIHRYYANVPYEELAERAASDLAAAALGHLNFLARRKSNEALVRVYNPTVKEHGWTSHYTVVEISHDDMPFLVDTCQMEIRRHHFNIYLSVHTGCVKLLRDAKRQMTALLEPKEERADLCTLEAPIRFEITRIEDPAVRESLCKDLERVLKDVRMTVADWKPMNARLQEAIDELTEHPPTLPPAQVQEVAAFLEWLKSDHFIFLSYRDYTLVNEKGEKALKINQNTGLGIHRNTKTSKEYHAFSDLPIKLKELMLSPEVLVLAKTNTRSSVHRDVYTDYVGIKRFDEKGNMIGERRFIGLYTSATYYESIKTIPLLRSKVKQVFENSGLLANSHAGKGLFDVLESLPRDDLLQGTVGELTTLAMGILNMQTTDRVRLFARRDIFGRYFSLLVYVPRDRYDLQLQEKMREILLQSLESHEVTASTDVNDSPMARIHYVVHLQKPIKTAVSFSELESKLAEAARLWCDGFAELVLEKRGEEAGQALLQTYGKAFSYSYQEAYTPAVALHDIGYIERLEKVGDIELSLYMGTVPNSLHLKIFSCGDALSLSTIMPIFGSMGLSVMDEHPYPIKRPDGMPIWVHDFDTRLEHFDQNDLLRIKANFKEAFKNIFSGVAGNDQFNRLIVSAGLTWREAMFLRAIAKYARQVAFKFSKLYIEQTFHRYSLLAKQILELFTLRFCPEIKKREEKIARLEKEFLTGLNAVSNLDEDKIFRFYWAVIHAMLRTNFFQKNSAGEHKSYVSFKFSPEKIPDLPLPRPKFEIFVYSTEFEGVHLRMSKVARGGIRWSDRPEDFRTEVLGLMKAQQVKNAIIVPAGAKGGFYPKRLPVNTDRTIVMNNVIACYQNFIRGLLDVTDNLVQGKVVHPKDVVRYDEDDTYLVVAADKGTATFSDIANQIALDANFWLGDAFASGGSQGYDHKKMGITAKGAWESVKRHFYRLGMDIRSTEFTAVGIGDMSGDVFGNGLLLSPHLRLIAAFNHQHIFIDPNPKAAAGFKERRRLFNLPRSSWSDYNPALISQGGGVFERRAKVIKVNAQIAMALDIEPGDLEPNDLIRAILKAPVDLLWNGGIGTYAKSKEESHLQVGDKTNDGLRVNGIDLRCKVIGEGGNLGFTQLSRIEYALNRGLNYTDFIDNSGGVNCSDHEVNLKILLSDALQKEQLTLAARNRLLAELTSEIGELVLRDNYEQAQAIDLGIMRSSALLNVYKRYLNHLVAAGAINREIEYLPDEKTFIEREDQRTGLTRPELAILFSYTKNLLKEALLKTNVPDDPYFFKYIERAFPRKIKEKFAKNLEHHYLRREIITTQIINGMVNEMGCVLVFRLQEETGATLADIVQAYVAVRDIFDMPVLWSAIEKLDGKVTTDMQIKMMLSLTQLMRRSMRWLLVQHHFALNLSMVVKKFRQDAQDISFRLHQLMKGEARAHLQQAITYYKDAGVPLALATKVEACSKSFAIFDIIYSAHSANIESSVLAEYYYYLNNEMSFFWLKEQVNAQVPINQWDILALVNLRDECDRLQAEFAMNVFQYAGDKQSVVQAFSDWKQHYKKVLDRWIVVIAELKRAPQISAVMLFIVLKELAALVKNTHRNKRNNGERNGNGTH